MKTLQIEAHKDLGDRHSNNELLKAAGIKRIHFGWYTLYYNGVQPDPSNVTNAIRNPKGELKCET